LNVLEGDVEQQLLPLTQLRQQLSRTRTPIKQKDYGTGSDKSIAISTLINKVAVRHKYGQLLYRLVRYYQPVSIVEIGTSIGISAAYMGMAALQAAITSLEGSPDIARAAYKNHEQLGLSNIDVQVGNFNQTIPQLLNKLEHVGLVFFDGNHTEQATLQYFHQFLAKANEDSIFVFDDIYWSEGMYAAWQQIKQHPQVTLTIDVYQFGICFFKKGKTKEDFILRY
jgi:predicted O-methyltransferase YrrM